MQTMQSGVTQNDTREGDTRSASSEGVDYKKVNRVPNLNLHRKRALLAARIKKHETQPSTREQSLEKAGVAEIHEAEMHA